MFGKIVNYQVIENKVDIEFEKNKGIIEAISPTIINVFSPLKYKQHFSRAIEDLKLVKSELSVEKTNDFIVITTEKLKVCVYDDFKIDFYDINGNKLSTDYRGSREPFERHGNNDEVADGEGIKSHAAEQNHKIEIIKDMNGTEYFYGFGEKTGPMNKKNYYYEMWNTDDPSPHVEYHKALYKSIPFFITLKNQNAYGIFFDNNFRTYFDMGKENSKYYYFASDDGNIDYYFIYGPEVKKVVSGYTYLTGRVPLPQIWALGYQQSRWSYSPESRVWNLAEKFREKDIPCDVLHLDIDYMDGYRVFTWDKNRFSNPKEFTSKLKDKGFKIVTIIDPGVKKDKGYNIYDKGIENGFFAVDRNGTPYVNEVWPGEALYPDFSKSAARKWWAENQKIMMDTGVSGIWNDMNEPASFKGPLPDDVQFDNDGKGGNHLEIHNIYGHLMAKATYAGIKEATNKRPFVITRACYAGSQKYSTVWTGDNHSFWEHLRMSIPMLLNLGMSGMGFCGTDVGGFQFDCTPELLSRWVQVGCFTPLFRNHACIHTRDQEPWAFDQQTEDINRKYIKLRYKLIPYLYDIMRNLECTGLPVMRPLYLEYQNDEKTYEINDQFLVGKNILVAPILAQGQKARSVYLPAGRWVDYWTKKIHDGGKNIIKETPLDICPIYIKEGSIIPNYPPQNYIGEKKIEQLELDIYPGDSEYETYLDDGESFEYRNGIYNTYKISMKNDISNRVLKMNIENNYSGLEQGYKSMKIKLNCINPDKVIINGRQLDDVNNIILSADKAVVSIYY